MRSSGMIATSATPGRPKIRIAGRHDRRSERPAGDASRPRTCSCPRRVCRSRVTRSRRSARPRGGTSRRRRSRRRAPPRREVAVGERRRAPMPSAASAGPAGISQVDRTRSAIAPSSGCSSDEPRLENSSSDPAAAYEYPRSRTRNGSSGGTAPCTRSTDRCPNASMPMPRRSMRAETTATAIRPRPRARPASTTARARTLRRPAVAGAQVAVRPAHLVVEHGRELVEIAGRVERAVGRAVLEQPPERRRELASRQRSIAGLVPDLVTHVVCRARAAPRGCARSRRTAPRAPARADRDRCRSPSAPARAPRAPRPPAPRAARRAGPSRVRPAPVQRHARDAGAAAISSIVVASQPRAAITSRAASTKASVVRAALSMLRSVTTRSPLAPVNVARSGA